MTQASINQLQQAAAGAAPLGGAVANYSPGFGSAQSYELAIRQAKLLSSSTLVPAQYRQQIEKKKGGNTTYEENANAIPNCVIAMNMAQRMGADPLMVMQNLYIVEGRPSWSSQWIIAAINGCGRFSPLRFEIKSLGEKTVEYTTFEWDDNLRKKVPNAQKIKINDKVCVAWATEKETGERIESPAVSIEMAVMEGWYSKNGSKWKTMDEVMLRYRTASFFGKLYAPELLMGLQTVEELQDAIEAVPQADGSFSVNVDQLRTGPAAQAGEQAQTTGSASPSAGKDVEDAVVVEPGQEQQQGGATEGQQQEQQQQGQGQQQGQQPPGTDDFLAQMEAAELAELKARTAKAEAKAEQHGARSNRKPIDAE